MSAPDVSPQEQLVELLRKRYTAEPVPPCRVCGGELDVASCGGGEATKWACSGQEPIPGNENRLRYKPGRTPADQHYADSHFTQYRGGDSDVLALLDLVRVESPPPAPLSSPTELLALAVVRWDGGGEDGCAFCGGEWAGGDAPGVDPFVLHDSECIVVTHRLALIERLMDGDPAADSEDGKLLVELATAQERYEKVSPSAPEGNPE